MPPVGIKFEAKIVNLPIEGEQQLTAAVIQAKLEELNGQGYGSVSVSVVPVK